jgi:carbon-monoxide dehydrogenase medium subunit
VVFDLQEANTAPAEIEEFMRWEAYHLPHTVEEALRLLAQYQGRARVIGGGTDYFVDDREGASPAALVDVTRIDELRSIREQDGYIVIGCGVTHAEIVRHPLIQQQGMALAEACGQIGGPQVRNVATLAGNIAHALPAADGTVALLALDGEVLVASLGEGATRAMQMEWWPLARAFKGPGQSAIDSTRQVLVAARFHPTGGQAGSAFARVMRPQGVALPVMGLAVCVQMQEEYIVQTRVALGPVAPMPFRAKQTEAFLQGKPANDETLRLAVEVLLSECNPRTSAHRATAEYRREVIPVLFEQAMSKAMERCQAVGVSS